MEEQKKELGTAQKSRTNYVFLIPILMGVTLALGVWMGTKFIPPIEGTHAEIQENSSKFNTILNMIEDRYVDTVDHNMLIESSIKGMITKLDPHSSYIPASDLPSVNEQLDGKFGGVGIRFIIHDDTLVATHIMPESPSLRAGLEPGDRIIKVDDEAITGKDVSNEKVMDLLKGKIGTRVVVSVFRKGKVEDISIVRGSINVSSIDAAIMLSPTVGFIKLNSFTFKSAQEFISAAASLKEKGMEKLIFDLRNNGGGSLGEATEIIDQFLGSGKLIVYTVGRTEKRKDYVATGRGLLEDTELVVLINSLSASASEIVAGAIQDNDRGLIMGRRSFGKGLVQDQKEFTDGSALRLTIARYYTPTGRSIQKPYGDGVDYDNDYFERYENGELLNEDSVKFDESLKYQTPGGRIVYGGGGIYPDTFVPNDTAGASYYLTQLYYAGAFNHWAINYLDKNRKNLTDFDQFNRSFNVNTSMFEGFIQYAKKLGVAPIPYDIVTSREVIKNRMKAEIARHVWEDNGYYSVYLEHDLDVIKALEHLN